MSGSACRLFICRNIQPDLMETYLETGFTEYRLGLGRQAAINAASCLDTLLADLLKYFCEAFSIPKIPSPISATFIYTSRILLLPHIFSIIKVKYTSSPFLSQLRPCHKKTFFAVC